MGYKVPVGLSNKHLHLSAKDLEALFGAGYELHPTKPLKQPGQFAAEEKVDIVGPKGTLKGIRVLGPVRPETQIELAMTDCRAIGVSAPVRESGKLDGTPGVKLVGPAGEITIDEGVIIAKRHIHFNPEQAAGLGVENGQVVKVLIKSARTTIYDDVVCRVNPNYDLAMHIDTDECNAAGAFGVVYGEIVK